MEKFKAKLIELKARFVELPVGGAFHTPYMEGAAENLRKEPATDMAAETAAGQSFPLRSLYGAFL